MGTLHLSETSATTISISWETPVPCAPTQNVTNYKIYYKKTTTSLFTSTMVNVVEQHKLEGLDPAFIYQIKVSAINRNGEGENSTILRVNTNESCMYKYFICFFVIIYEVMYKHIFIAILVQFQL